jgi:Protein of unknown function (DUF3048) N-terminal domain/Protein of unknown function (DUF3048) C-terminal domain
MPGTQAIGALLRDRRKLLIAAAACLAAAGLVIAGLLAFTGRAVPRAHSRHLPVPAPSATPVPVALVSPFTGEPAGKLGPVLIVKIDNLEPARPQTGLTRADIVYVLPVEGGLSRLMAVFSSRFPSIIGPVRSSREDDIKLIRQFGRPAFAYSGADPRLLPLVHRARIVDEYAGIAGGYYRDQNRFAPHNLYAHTRRLLAEARRASKARDIGFRFGPAPPGGRVTRSRSIGYLAASFTFSWSAARHRWLVSMDGTPAASTEGGRLSAATVIIQHTTVRDSRFHGHVPSPYAVTTGAGTAIVLRNGKSWRAHWSRPRADGGTTFTTNSGRPMTFARGPVWIVLAAR